MDKETEDLVVRILLILLAAGLTTLVLLSLVFLFRG